MGYLCKGYLLFKPYLCCEMEGLCLREGFSGAVCWEGFSEAVGRSHPGSPDPLSTSSVLLTVKAGLIIPAPPASPGCQEDKVG